MAKGAKIECKRKAGNKVRLDKKGSDESDEDYKVSEDEEYDKSEDEHCSSLVGDESEESFGELLKKKEDIDWREKKVKKVRKPKTGKAHSVKNKKKNKIVKPRNKKVTYKEEEDEESDDFEDDYYDVKKRKKNRASCRNEEDNDTDFSFEEEEEDEFVNENQRKKPRVLRTKAFRNADYKKKNKISYKDENEDSDNDDDDEDDTEFNPVVVLKRVKRRIPEKKQVVRRRNRSRTSKEFSDDKPTRMKKKTRTTSGRRRRRKLIVNSDSDFMSLGSSDYEYTISGEEREQVREANKICCGHSTSLRSCSLLKTIDQETQRKPTGKKGKEKVSGIKIEVGKQVCGICLSEEGKRTVRGVLNSCTHHFCFLCIMEWSKVESRCPLCRQRYTTISRTSRADGGHDFRGAIFPVPARDQVYQPSEEELRGYLEPYESVLCTECHFGGDDALMLLCDLCDSPAHTYCVGLGREVPDGNWYCEGCRPVALASSNPQYGLTPTPDHGTRNNFSVASSPVATVREAIDLNEAYVPDTPVAQASWHSQSPRNLIGDLQSPSFASGSSALTVLERRRVQRQIQQILTTRGRLSERNQGTATVSGINLFGSRITSNGAVIHQNSNFQERTEGEVFSLFGREVFSSRSSSSRGQALRNEASASINPSHGEFSGVNSTYIGGFRP